MPESAQPAPPDKRAARKRAKALFVASQQHLLNNNFDAAIKLLTQAYNLDPRGFRIYNLAVVYDLKGDWVRALEHYQRFLDTRPKNRSLVRLTRKLMRTAQRKLAKAAKSPGHVADPMADQAANRSASPADQAANQPVNQAANQAANPAGAPMANATADSGPEQRLVPSRGDASVADSVADRRHRSAIRSAGQGTPAAVIDSRQPAVFWREWLHQPGSGKRFVGAGLVLTGGLTLGASAVYGWKVRGIKADLARETRMSGAWTDANNRQVGEFHTMQQRMIRFSIAGAVLLGTGATLYYLGLRASRESSNRRAQVRVAPSLAPTGAGIVVHARF